jgi:hypothetical protein
MKSVRLAAQEAHLRPIGRLAVLPDDGPTKRPKQAQGVAGHIRRTKPLDPIPAETIERVFPDKTAILFATGPGLTPEVVAEVMAARSVNDLKLFGCNDAFRIVPELDVHYACDFSWWRKHFQSMKDYPTTHGMWTQEPAMSRTEFPGLRRIAGTAAAGLSRKQNLIHFGNNSGYQLINLAYLFGVRNFILCGYNMKVVNKRRHFFGDHPEGLNRSGSYSGFVQNYETIKPADYGIEIINATPDSALKCFPKMGLADALQRFF